MKRILFVLAVALALVLAGCPQPGVSVTVTPPSTPSTPPTSSPPPAGLTGPVLAALYDGTTVKLWDGTNAVAWKTGATAAIGNGMKIAVGNTLYFLSSSGAVTSAMNLPAAARGVLVVGDPDVWTFENITNAQAFAIDYTPPATGGNYTRVWLNSVQVGDWHANGWTLAQYFTTANGDIVAQDSLGHFHDMSRTIPNQTYIAWAWAGGPIFYFPTYTDGTLTIYDAAHPGGTPATWVGGNARGSWGKAIWQQFGSVFYDANGDEYDPTTETFYAGATPMVMWNQVPSFAWQSANGVTWPQVTDPPTMLYSYSDSANLYYIECNTGSLISWTVQTGVISYVHTGLATAIGSGLYAGDGLQTTGLAKVNTLAPTLINGSLYYHNAGNLMQVNVTSKAVSTFSVDQQMWVLK